MKKLIALSLAALLAVGALTLSGCKTKQENGGIPSDSNASDSSDIAVQNSTDGSSQSDTAAVSDTAAKEQSTATDKVTNAQTPTQQARPQTNQSLGLPSQNRPVENQKPTEGGSKLNSYAWHGDGTYKCGSANDCLEPGEYYIMTNGDVCALTLTDSNGQSSSQSVKHDAIAVLQSGYTISVKGGTFTKITPSKSSGGGYSEGIYKVGRDIPAGEYVAAQGTNAACITVYYEPGQVKAGTPKDLRFFENSIYITLTAGQYIRVASCTLKSISAVSPAKPDSDGFYSSGMYKVGRDLPAGSYTVIGENKNAMYSIYNNSSYGANSLVSFDSLGNKDQKLITLKAGEYISLAGCKMKAYNAG